jgi:hypothetical protein
MFGQSGNEWNLHMRKEFLKGAIVALLSAVLCCVTAQTSSADQPGKPALLSFKLSQDNVDISSGNLILIVEIVVSNPTGISSQQTQVTVTDGGMNTLITQLRRTDTTPNSSLQNVKFEGALDVSSLPAGAYLVSASPVTALNANGTNGFSSDTLYPTTGSSVVGAKNYLLIRQNGNLNFSYSTFKGPAFDKSSGTVYDDPKYTTVAQPIWAVGESFNASDYYELMVPTLSLKVKTITPSTCTSNGMSVLLIATGACSFEVYTDKTNDYQYFKDDQTVTVLPARTKPTYVVSPIPTQSSAVLPLNIQTPGVFGINGYVTPISATPSICHAVGNYINIASGGTCTLLYSTPGTANYLPSDTYTLTFQITRTPQSVTFSPPAKVSLTSKNLALTASASSGLPIAFDSTTPKICSVTGNSLNLLSPGACGVSATQIGSATIEPASITHTIFLTREGAKKPLVKTIKCIKKGKSKTFTGVKCPVGYTVGI